MARVLLVLGRPVLIDLVALTLSHGVSGRVLLRLPKTLHRLATRAAARDGVSVNTFLVSAVARELGRREPRQ
jgi:hypothetical protein